MILEVVLILIGRSTSFSSTFVFKMSSRSPCIPLTSSYGCSVPPPSPALINHDNMEYQEPCPSRDCPMLPVDQGIRKVVKTPSILPIKCPSSHVSGKIVECSVGRRKVLSLNTSPSPPSPSPLYQSLSVGKGFLKSAKLSNHKLWKTLSPTQGSMFRKQELMLVYRFEKQADPWIRSRRQ